jgi:hypothetical protein
MDDHTLASLPPVPAVPSPPPLSSALTPRVLREAIASALERVSARDWPMSASASAFPRTIPGARKTHGGESGGTSSDGSGPSPCTGQAGSRAR